MSPIYVPDTGGIAFASPLDGSLLDRVNQELRNYVYRGVADFEVDDDTADSTVFELPHENIVAASANVNGTPTAAFTLEDDPGFVVTTSALTEGDILEVAYTYRYWNDTMVKQAINAGIEALFDRFYHADTDTSLTTAAGTYEYELPAGTEVVRYVEYDSGHGYRRLRPTRYTVHEDGSTRTLRFRDDPNHVWPLRVHIIKRPTALTSDTDTLNEVGLPDRSAEPIVMYACMRLLRELMGKRARLDTALAAQGQSVPSIYHLTQAANAYQMAFEVELERRRMSPWSAA